MKTRDLIELAGKTVGSYAMEDLIGSGFMPREGLYFPAIFYPPVPMYPVATEEELLKGCPPPGDPLAVYIHIPFCPSHCRYCHWVISVGNTEEERDEYLTYLEKEIDLYKQKLGLAAIRPTSILIGGGTPSLLNTSQMKRLLACVNTKFDLCRCSQITLELEPETILGPEGLEKLKSMKAGGINRVSLGVQSFDDRILKNICRNHTAQEAEDAVRAIRRAGLESISLDLIYGLPGMTEDIWIETLTTAHELDVDAYQLYRLRIVPHGARAGAIKKDFDEHPQSFPALDQIYRMKALGIIIAKEKGFKEVSRRVFAKSERHNSEYLKDHTIRLSDVLGFGISSWTNLSDRSFIGTGEGLQEYYAFIREGRLPITHGKIRTQDDQRRWAMCLPLKHTGVPKKLYREKTGVAVSEVFRERIERLKKAGLLEEDEEILRLTQKGGFFADETVIQFYHPQYMPFERSCYLKGELNPYDQAP